MRRSAASVGSNLAEGAGRATHKDFAHFTTIAIGSLNELENHCFIASDLGFVQGSQLTDLRNEIREIRSMTLALRQTLRRRS
jgi:four helix bundle protein